MAEIRRASTRFRTDVPAVLRRGGTDISVRLVDQSAGGFSVLAKGNVRFTRGEVCGLYAGATATEVRVVNCRREHGDIRVGLERVRAIPLVRRGRHARNGHLRRPSTVASVLAIGPLLAIGLAIAVFAWQKLFADVDPSDIRALSGVAARDRRQHSSFLPPSPRDSYRLAAVIGGPAGSARHVRAP